MKLLTMMEQILLITILKLADEAYGVQIRKQVEEVTGKDVKYGTLYNSLDQLVRKGYVTSRAGEPTAVRGGRRKIYYSITPIGRDALQTAHDLQKNLWEGVWDYVKNG